MARLLNKAKKLKFRLLAGIAIAVGLVIYAADPGGGNDASVTSDKEIVCPGSQVTFTASQGCGTEEIELTAAGQSTTGSSPVSLTVTVGAGQPSLEAKAKINGEVVGSKTVKVTSITGITVSGPTITQVDGDYVLPIDDSCEIQVLMSNGAADDSELTWTIKDPTGQERTESGETITLTGEYVGDYEITVGCGDGSASVTITVPSDCLSADAGETVKVGPMRVTFPEGLDALGQPDSEGYCSYQPSDFVAHLPIPHESQHVGVADAKVTSEKGATLTFKARRDGTQYVFKEIQLDFDPTSASSYIDITEKQGIIPVQLSEVGVTIKPEGDYFTIFGQAKLVSHITAKLEQFGNALAVNPPDSSSAIEINYNRAKYGDSGIQQSLVAWDFSKLKLDPELEKPDFLDDSEVLSLLKLDSKFTTNGIMAAQAELTEDFGKAFKTGGFQAHLLKGSRIGFVYDLPGNRWQVIMGKASVKIGGIKDLKGDVVFSGQRMLKKPSQNSDSDSDSGDSDSSSNSSGSGDSDDSDSDDSSTCPPSGSSYEWTVVDIYDLTQKSEEELLEYLDPESEYTYGWRLQAKLTQKSSLEAFGFEIKPLTIREPVLDENGKPTGEWKNVDKEAILTADFTDEWEFERFEGRDIGAKRSELSEEEKQKRLDQLKAKIAENDAKRSELGQKIESLRFQVIEKQTELDQLDSEISDLQQINYKVKAIDKQIKSLVQAQEGARQKKSSYLREKSAKHSQVQRLKSRIRVIERQIERGQGNLDELRRELSEKQAEVSELETRLAILERLIDGARLTISLIQEEIKALRRQRADLDAIAKNPERLRRMLEDLEERRKAVKAELTSLESQFKAAKKQLQQEFGTSEKMLGEQKSLKDERFKLQLDICQIEVLAASGDDVLPKLARLSLGGEFEYHGFKLLVDEATFGTCCLPCNTQSEDFMQETCDCQLQNSNSSGGSSTTNVLKVSAAVSLEITKKSDDEESGSGFSTRVAFKDFTIDKEGEWSLGEIGAKFETDIAMFCFRARFEEQASQDSYVGKFVGCFKGTIGIAKNESTGNLLEVDGSITIGVASRTVKTTDPEGNEKSDLDFYTFGLFSLNVKFPRLPIIIPPAIKTGLNLNKIGGVIGWNVKISDPANMSVSSLFSDPGATNSYGSWVFGGGFGICDDSQLIQGEMYVVYGIGEDQFSASLLTRLTIEKSGLPVVDGFEIVVQGNATWIVEVVELPFGTFTDAVLKGNLQAEVKCPKDDKKYIHVGGKLNSTTGLVDDTARLDFYLDPYRFYIHKPSNQDKALAASILQGKIQVLGDAKAGMKFHDSNYENPIETFYADAMGSVHINETATFAIPQNFKPFLQDDGKCGKNSDGQPSKDCAKQSGNFGFLLTAVANVDAEGQFRLTHNDLKGSVYVKKFKLMGTGVALCQPFFVESAYGIDMADVLVKLEQKQLSAKFGTLEIRHPTVPAFLLRQAEGFFQGEEFLFDLH